MCPCSPTHESSGHVQDHFAEILKAPPFRALLLFPIDGLVRKSPSMMYISTRPRSTWAILRLRNAVPGQLLMAGNMSGLILIASKNVTCTDNSPYES
jgi:hypothetical protein